MRFVEFMSNPMLRSVSEFHVYSRDIPRHNTIAGCEKPHMHTNSLRRTFWIEVSNVNVFEVGKLEMLKLIQMRMK